MLFKNLKNYIFSKDWSLRSVITHCTVYSRMMSRTSFWRQGSSILRDGKILSTFKTIKWTINKKINKTQKKETNNKYDRQNHSRDFYVFHRPVQTNVRTSQLPVKRNTCGKLLLWRAKRPVQNWTLQYQNTKSVEPYLHPLQTYALRIIP